MDVEQTIRELCQTYGVDRSFGERMRTLLERAASTTDDKRDRLLSLVQRSFAEEARRKLDSADKPSTRLTTAELSVVRTVANILHEWDSPTWLKVWASGSHDPQDRIDREPPTEF